MPLLNYTTSVPVDRSVAQIQQLLIKAGASKIMCDYDPQGNVTAISFQILDNGTPFAFSLPTNYEPVYATLKRQNVPARYCNPDQARRVAWRITKDWIEAQLAIIETRMVTTAQVFLPYAITNNGQTLYTYISENRNLLSGGN